MTKPKFSLKQYLQTVFRTVVRHPLDNTGLAKAQIIFSNFINHIQPVKVHQRTLKFTTTLGMGVVSVSLFLILSVSGVLLMFHYVPSTTIGPEGLPEAYQRMLNLRSNVFLGSFLRNLHLWSAHAMIISVALHLARVFLMGSYKAPREFNWSIGVAMGMLVLLLSYTGYLLPWDQLAFWGVRVGTEIARLAPGGNEMRALLLGDSDVGSEALVRFYVLHVAVIPGGLAFLLGLHLFRVRKDGGLARPADASDEKPIPADECGEVQNNSFYRDARTYQLVEVVKHDYGPVNQEVDQTVFSWPKLITREVTLFVIVLVLMSLAAIVFNAPLEGPADPSHPTNPAKAPWYFLGLQELSSYHGFWGGVGIPGALFGLFLLWPYIEMFIEQFFGIRREGISGRWFSRERWLENLVFIAISAVMIGLIVVGLYFRGADWGIVLPWASGMGGH